MEATNKSEKVAGRKRLRKAVESDDEEAVSCHSQDEELEIENSSPKRKSARSTSTKHDKASPKSKKSSNQSESSKSRSIKSKSDLPSTSIFSRSVIELVGSDDDFEQPPPKAVKTSDKSSSAVKAKAKKSPPKRSRKIAPPLPQEEDDIITLGDTDDEIEDASWKCEFCCSSNLYPEKTCEVCKSTLTPDVSSQSTSSSRQLWQESLETPPVTKKSRAKPSVKSRSASNSQSSRKRKSETDDFVSQSDRPHQSDPHHDFDDFLFEGSQNRSFSQSIESSLTPTDEPVIKAAVEDWCDKHSPQSFDVLAVHAKKVAQVSDWIDRNVCSTAPSASSSTQSTIKQSMLILTGPPGCCKSTMVELVAAARSVTCSRFEESLQPRANFSSTRYADRDGESLAPKSKLDVFEQFLSQSTRYSSLVGDVVSGKRLVLIEELPFVGDDALHQRFISIIQTALYQSHFSLILCLSDMHEDSGAFAVEQLLTSAILCDPHVAHIECNAVNVTLMKKALRRVIEKENLDVNPSQLDAIVARARGDLRQAVQTLQFEFQHQHPPPKSSKSKAPSRSEGVKGKGSKAKVAPAPVVAAESDVVSLQSSARDSSASLFHSLGRILYAKREYSVDSIIEQCADERQILLPMIQQNYVPFFRLDESLDHVVAASHSISLADCGITEDFTADSFREVSLWLLCEEIVQERALYRAEHPDSTVYRPGQSGLLAFRASDALRVSRIVARKKLMSVRYDVSNLPDSKYYTQTLPYSELVCPSNLGESFRFSQGKEVRLLPNTSQTEIAPQINRAQTVSTSSFAVEEDPIEDT